MRQDKNNGDLDPTIRPLSLGLLLFATVLAIIVRLVPHPLNLTPIGALGLFGGARLRSWQAFILPLFAMIVSDFALWAVLHYPPFNPFVYVSFIIYVLLGRSLLNRTESPWRIGLVTGLGSLQFFLITNLGVWLGSSVDPASMPDGAAYQLLPGGMYPVPQHVYARSLAGLLWCYLLALPFTNQYAPPLGFLGNALLGDLLFSGFLFAVYAWLARAYFPRERIATPAHGNRVVG